MPHLAPAFARPSPIYTAPLLPLGAMLLASSGSALAQQANDAEVKSLKPVTITEKAEEAQGKDSVRATTTTIGKGKQDLRDIPQSITVVTEKLVDDRNLDTLKDVLHNTAGVTFLAAEGGEEDIRLRGFSLATSGDIFLDGMRDPAFYDRDTFNNDRIELLRGSASMLFGRGSTGGAVNQVGKQARAINEHEITTTLGSYQYRRVTGDFNIHTGEDAGLRINAMVTTADNNGAGSSIDKRGLAANYRFGIGTRDEISLSLSTLENNNGINYGIPFIRNYTGAPASETSLVPINPNSFYGLDSDRNDGVANIGTLAHTHRFDDDSELKTQVRKGVYTRDLRSGIIRFQNATTLSNFSDATRLTRGQQAKVQDFDSIYAQSDYSTKFSALGFKHEVITGVEVSTETKHVYALSSITKPTTSIGTPDDGASVNENSRSVRLSNTFNADNLGLYAQDLMQVAPHWKLLGGLRFDRMRGNYASYSAAGVLNGAYQQTIGNWSQRVGALYQPNELSSYHFSWGTSFNTSADTYSYSANSANTPPEQSRNVEFGAKLDSADKRYTARFAIFQSTKFNERNTDPDSAATQFLLSGARHTTGLEIDVTGYLTPKWEVYGSYMWMPDAMIDKSNSTSNGAREGERPGLTPIHSGTVWTTYQFTPELRMGAGVNFRSEQSPATNPGFMAPGYATLDLMGEYKFSERYVLKVNVTNALDKLYADSLYTGHYTPGSGRNIQATMNIKF
ncbi:MAG: TonB-dependent receptor [Curvibacter sp. RIFCSPHIGHO2_12_FULL_63_18]|nr:MAG: TonB-dependent receptor [Curvibacter sp. GWA2_63_95]OGP01300.1 MAG: TonB-dependent receptor [Curvibacter sp. RIFCSPHIGHO2_12_FULL_63_18]HCX82172.1 TonB-dependent siderophore receptor [Rhodoferax sp.]